MESSVRLIDLENVQTSDIWKVLSDYYIEGELAADGDIVIERSVSFYVKVDPRYAMLRFFCYFTLRSSQANPKFLESMKTINGASSSVKYSLLNTSVMAEYGIPLFGCIDHKHLLKVVEHFSEEVETVKMVLSEFVED